MSVYQLGETERLSAIITQESYVLLSKHPSLSEPWSNSSHLWAGVVTSGNEVPDGKEPELQYYGVRTMGFSIKAKRQADPFTRMSRAFCEESFPGQEGCCEDLTHCGNCYAFCAQAGQYHVTPQVFVSFDVMSLSSCPD